MNAWGCRLAYGHPEFVPDLLDVLFLDAHEYHPLPGGHPDDRNVVASDDFDDVLKFFGTDDPGGGSRHDRVCGAVSPGGLLLWVDSSFYLAGVKGAKRENPPFRVGMKAEPPFVTQLPETIPYCKNK